MTTWRPPTPGHPGAARWLRSPIKRAIDITAGAAALVVLSPVIAATALAVRLRLGRGVLFRQTRAGLDGEPFDVLKFRTMTDARGADGDLLPDDERLTSFGHRLRATSLDELPQLVNVARGDMSVVGPRPLPVDYVERYDDVQRRRLLARPGLTGWAQVHGRNSLDWPDRLAHDVDYVERASPVLDARIVLRTIRIVLTGAGISGNAHVTMEPFRGNSSPED